MESEVDIKPNDVFQLPLCVKRDNGYEWTGLSERIYGLGRGPWHDKCVGFGVCLAAKSHRFQANDGVLRLIGDEVAARVQGGFPLPMGIEREDRWE